MLLQSAECISDAEVNPFSDEFARLMLEYPSMRLAYWISQNEFLAAMLASQLRALEDAAERQTLAHEDVERRPELRRKIEEIEKGLAAARLSIRSLT
jgi:hypothetical protein